MLNLFKCKQCADFVKVLCNRLVCVISRKTCKLSCFLGKNTLFVNRNYNRNFFIFLAHDKVVNTVTRSSMNTACTAFKSYVVADNNERSSVDKRVSSFHIFKLAATDNTDCFVIGDTCVSHCLGCKVGRHNIILAVCFKQTVFVIRTYADSNVCRKRPSGCCPDNEVGFIKLGAHCGKLTHIVGYSELNID